MIQSEQVRLRAVERGDLPLFTVWLNDREVTWGTLRLLPLSMAQEEQWYEKQLQLPPEEQGLVIEINEKNNWRPIGVIGLHAFDRRCRSAELGIIIGDKTCWSQGHGTAALRLLLAHGFDTLNLHRIALRVFEDNRRAIRAYEKTGFVVEGCLRDAMFRGGQYVNTLIMSVLQTGWDAGKGES